MIKVAVMGYGTIGSGVVEVIEQNQDILKDRAGDGIEVTYILDLREFPGTSVEKKIVHDFSVIEKDASIQIVVEAMGGLNPAYPFVKSSLLAGKHVVTSNKALVAAHGTELLKIAKEKNVNFFFEASVGGGIPIIRPLYTGLQGEKIEGITGILNGTTNFILSKMDKEGETFEAALKEAQDLGYAERNPEADVEGHDTCRKIAILTAMATGCQVNYEDIYTEGITKITDTDFKYAEKMDTSIKLFGTSQIDGDEIHAWVAPVMIGKNHPLYFVNDVFNGIMVKGNMVGETLFYGSGAGKLPTASAVVADIIEAAKNLDHNVSLGWGDRELEISPMETSVHRYFIRISGSKKNRFNEVEQALGHVVWIELESMDEFGVLTELMAEVEFQSGIKQIQGVLQFIRAEV